MPIDKTQTRENPARITEEASKSGDRLSAVCLSVQVRLGTHKDAGAQKHMSNVLIAGPHKSGVILNFYCRLETTEFRRRSFMSPLLDLYRTNDRSRNNDAEQHRVNVESVNDHRLLVD